MAAQFEKILIANRGDVALRIHRACREMGIASVVAHSTADASSMPVGIADETVCIGPPPTPQSYLNVPAILSAAVVAGVDAIHPGIGFLAENAEFAQMVDEHGFAFIGPRPEHIRVMGDKVAAKKTMIELGVPVVPGSDGAVTDADEALKLADGMGYPVLVKAAAGGGGRGMKIAHNKDEMAEALSMARSEARGAFGDDTVYIEKYLDGPRHIEVQVLADHHGNVVHFGERDCSIQRRHQKVIEEAPSPGLNDDEREEVGRIAAAATAKLGYHGVGTFEFLYQDGKFYFMEMNTRLQVEHPITEEISGVDLVREQIRVASGAPLGYGQSDVRLRGHSIECRINAEHPVNFTPSPGKVTSFHAAGGLGVRFDSALYTGYSVPPYYDSLIAKLIVRGRNRNECLMRLRRSLDECVIEGIDTNIPLHQSLVHEPDFVDGNYDIKWLERRLAERAAEET
ncbi:MAG: acetyl-CoA carboxylase biotin carboxylase subunit [Pseudomonadota bacterium]